MKTILIVDDEYAVVDALRAVLEDEGYRVLTAANGKEGLDQLAAERVDLVLLDLMMPVLDGRDMLVRLRAGNASSEVPVIVMSAAASAAPAGAGVTYSEFLHKPFDVDRLLTAVQRLVGSGEPASGP